jgi:DNA-binding NarL/FixJ family response regulator
VSSATVDRHVHRCLAKLGARTPAHAIALGLQAGEIAIDLEQDRSR